MERLPLPIISGNIFKPGEKHIVTCRNREGDPPFTPERFFLQFPADWIIHMVTIGVRVVISTPHAGSLFSPDAAPPQIDWGTIKPGQEVVVTAEYVGLLDNVRFAATLLGVRPIRR